MFEIVCPDVFFTERCPLACDYCFENKANKDIDIDRFKKYVEDASFASFFPFGGEPLLKIDLLTKVLNTAEEYKKKVLTQNLITNGILVPRYIDILKEYNFKVQISIDGPKKAHDKHRKYSNGRGSWNDVMKGIKACIQNDVDWSIHGVCTRDNLQHFSESIHWFFNIYKQKGIDTAINMMKNNTIQIIFEENYTDKDIDTVIKQFYNIAEWMVKEPHLTNEQKKNLLRNFFTRKGGSCGAGTALMAIDTNFDIYPCHRLATVPEKEDYKLGNIYKPKEFKNYKYYNSYQRVKKRGLYSSNTNLTMNFTNAWFMWCPATNMQTSKSVYYQNCKYNVMFTELERAIEDIKRRYKIQDGNTKQPNNR